MHPVTHCNKNGYVGGLLTFKDAINFDQNAPLLKSKERTYDYECLPEDVA